MVCEDCPSLHLIQSDLESIKTLVKLIAKHFHLAECDCSGCRNRLNVVLNDSIATERLIEATNELLVVDDINDIDSTAESFHPVVKGEVEVEPTTEETSNQWSQESFDGYESFRLPFIGDGEMIGPPVQRGKLRLQPAELSTPPQKSAELITNGSSMATGDGQVPSGSNPSWDQRRTPAKRKRQGGIGDSSSGGVERQFDCDYCGKSFIQRGHLEEHLRIHLGEKPFVCEFCGQNFRQKAHCVRHTRIHTGEKPYQCELCGKSFRQSFPCKQHQIRCQEAVEDSSNNRRLN